MKTDLKVKIVEKFKFFIAVSLAILMAGLILMIIRGMNVGIDFAGGAEIDISFGDYITNNPKVKEEVEKVIKSTVEENKFDFAGIRWSDTDAKISLNYIFEGKKINGDNEEEQKLFLDRITNTDIYPNETLQKKIYDSLSAFNTSNCGGSLEIDENFSSRIVNASTSRILLKNAIIATTVAIVVMLLYIAIRFTLSTGLAAVVALAHDILIMLSLVTIFQVKVNVTFIAAVITIVGYSINATIVIFDRIREVRKLDSMKDASDADVANKSIVDTLGRTIFTTITTLVVIVALAIVCAIMGVTTIEEFALPIIFGLLAGTYSSVFLSAAFWVMFRKIGKKITAKKSK